MSDYVMAYPSILVGIIWIGEIDIGLDGEEAEADIARIG